MPTQQTRSHGAGSEEQDLRLRNSLVEQYVMRTLGPPKGLHRVQIRPLWGHCLRVNVLVGADAASAKVVHSYFLVTDGLGKVVASTPRIIRQYSGDDLTPSSAPTTSTTDEGSFGG
jgi:hypothetical protein